MAASPPAAVPSPVRPGALSESAGPRAESESRVAAAAASGRAVKSHATAQRPVAAGTSLGPGHYIIGMAQARSAAGLARRLAGARVGAASPLNPAGDRPPDRRRRISRSPDRHGASLPEPVPPARTGPPMIVIRVMIIVIIRVVGTRIRVTSASESAAVLGVRHALPVQ
jgi:hypothetical protein